MSTGRFHWSNLSREVLFFTVNWTVAVPWIIQIFYQNWTLFALAMFYTGVMLYIRYVAKMTLASALRAVFTFLSGREKATNNWFKDFIRQR